MSFIDTLRRARGSRAAVLHEFWTQYDPLKRRVHAFLEGHDDVAFFVPIIERHVPAGTRVLVYRCEGKPQVVDAFSQITARVPGIQAVLFFVDKDLDDILGESLPSDPRIFVTEVYSVENYLVSRVCLERLYRDAIRLSEVVFDVQTLLNHFDSQLSTFYRSILPVMAWIVMLRRVGLAPNLNNVNLRHLFRFNAACEVSAVRGARLECLERLSGVAGRRPMLRELRRTARELARLEPKRVVRGKFEAWFFVEFWKQLLRLLQCSAEEEGGRLQVRKRLEHGNFITTLAAYAEAPGSLRRFLHAHFPPASERAVVAPAEKAARHAWFARWREWLRRS